MYPRSMFRAKIRKYQMFSLCSVEYHSILHGRVIVMRFVSLDVLLLFYLMSYFLCNNVSDKMVA